MALRDTWHKTIVYFGLAEPDDGYRDDDHEPPEPERELEDSYRERPNVRRLQSRRRRDEIDDIFADDSPRSATRATRVLRPADRRPVQGRGAGDPQPAGHRHGPLEAADRLRVRPHVRARRRHAADSRQ